MPDLLNITFRLQKFRNVTAVPSPVPVAPTDIGGDATDFTISVDEDTGFGSIDIPASGVADLTPLFAHINTPTVAYIEVPDKASLTVNGVSNGVVGPRWFAQIILSGASALVIANDQIPTGKVAAVDIVARYYIGGDKA